MIFIKILQILGHIWGYTSLHICLDLRQNKYIPPFPSLPAPGPADQPGPRAWRTGPGLYDLWSEGSMQELSASSSSMPVQGRPMQHQSASSSSALPMEAGSVPVGPVHAVPPPPKAYAKAVRHEEILVDVRGDGLSLLKHDTQLGKLAAHCRFPGHGNLCRAGRQLTGGKYNPCAGRPTGLLLAWMACAANYDTHTAHMAAMRTPIVHIEADLTCEKRTQWRAWLEDTHPAQSARIDQLERPRRGGEDKEPEGSP